MLRAGVALGDAVGVGFGVGMAVGIGVEEGAAVGIESGVAAGLLDKAEVSVVVSRPACRQASKNEASAVSPPRPAALRSRSRRLMRRLATGTSKVSFTSCPLGYSCYGPVWIKIAKYDWNVKP
jgi:hypothetical protein